MRHAELSEKIIGLAIEVHRGLGPGLLESAYEQCLAHELSLAGVPFALQSPLPVSYKGILLDCGYIIVELKSVDRLMPIHEAQLLTYMKLAKIEVGLLINFNALVLKDGLKRMVL